MLECRFKGEASHEKEAVALSAASARTLTLGSGTVGGALVRWFARPTSAGTGPAPPSPCARPCSTVTSTLTAAAPPSACTTLAAATSAGSAGLHSLHSSESAGGSRIASELLRDVGDATEFLRDVEGDGAGDSRIDVCFDPGSELCTEPLPLLALLPA